MRTYHLRSMIFYFINSIPRTLVYKHLNLESRRLTIVELEPKVKGTNIYSLLLTLLIQSIRISHVLCVIFENTQLQYLITLSVLVKNTTFNLHLKPVPEFPTRP